jgi:hypothetical protein
LAMMVVVGKRKTTTSTPQKVQISQIPPQNIQLDKVLLIKAANLTTAVTVTTTPRIQQSPIIPSHYHLHHQNLTNTTTTLSLQPIKYLSIALIQQPHLPPLKQLLLPPSPFL